MCTIAHGLFVAPVVWVRSKDLHRVFRLYAGASIFMVLCMSTWARRCLHFPRPSAMYAAAAISLTSLSFSAFNAVSLIFNAGFCTLHTHTTQNCVKKTSNRIEVVKLNQKKTECYAMRRQRVKKFQSHLSNHNRINLENVSFLEGNWSMRWEGEIKTRKNEMRKKKAKWMKINSLIIIYWNDRLIDGIAWLTSKIDTMTGMAERKIELCHIFWSEFDQSQWVIKRF